MHLTILTTSNLKVFILVDFHKTSSRGGKSTLTDIADHTQLGCSARLARKRRMILSSRSQGDMDDTMRTLEQQQLQESRIREEQLERRAEELQRQAEDSNRRAEQSNRRAETAEERVQY